MSMTYEFLVARADESAAEAEGARLDNVRQRALRSEAAWRDMAARALRLQRDREAEQRRRDRAREAEAAALATAS